jgi:hypothetical protein
MKKFLLGLTFLCCLFFISNTADAQKRKSSKAKTVRVKNYTTKKGKHVKSYKRSKPSKRHTYVIPFSGRKEEMAA